MSCRPCDGQAIKWTSSTTTCAASASAFDDQYYIPSYWAVKWTLGHGPTHIYTDYSGSISSIHAVVTHTIPSQTFIISSTNKFVPITALVMGIIELQTTHRWTQGLPERRLPWRMAITSWAGVNSLQIRFQGSSEHVFLKKGWWCGQETLMLIFWTRLSVSSQWWCCQVVKMDYYMSLLLIESHVRMNQSGLHLNKRGGLNSIIFANIFYNNIEYFL